MIHYYEQIGPLPKPPRSTSNRRRYDTTDLHRLACIRHARELHFDIEAIRALPALKDDPDQSCMAADVIARAAILASICVIVKIGLRQVIQDQLDANLLHPTAAQKPTDFIDAPPKSGPLSYRIYCYSSIFLIL